MRGQSDLLVIGAGPAGSAAGIEAARAGLDVCVVDRAQFPRPKTCGDAVSNGAAEIIAGLGAGGAFERAPRAVVRGAAAVFPDGSRVRRSYGNRPGYIMERAVLDNLLRERLEESGARLLQGVSIRRLERVHDAVVGARGDGFSWRARAVIAADGPGSVAWTALGAPPPRRRVLALAITAYLSDLPDAADTGYSEHYFERDLPCGYGWVFPPVEGLANVGVYQRADRYHDAGVPLAELLERFMARHPDRFEGAAIEGRTRSWQLPLAGRRPPPAMAGLLTAGDAARLIDPLTGEGIWHALASGRLAARSAVAALERGGLDRAAARRFQLEAARGIGWPSAVRAGIQRGMQLIVDRDLYRSRAVRNLLAWGYGRDALEVSKSL